MLDIVITNVLILQEANQRLRHGQTYGFHIVSSRNKCFEK
jgi:hypothetical protein